MLALVPRTTALTRGLQAALGCSYQPGRGRHSTGNGRALSKATYARLAEAGEPLSTFPFTKDLNLISPTAKVIPLSMGHSSLRAFKHPRAR